MKQRAVLLLTPHVVACDALLWERLKAVFDYNVESLSNARPKPLGSTHSVQAHYVTKRYADFAASLFRINDGFKSDMLSGMMAQIRNQVEKHLQHVAQGMHNDKEPIKQ